MTKEQIVARVKELNLPEGSYVVFGSCPLAVAGIREAGDVDLFITKELFAKLREEGWEEHRKGEDNVPLVKNNIEAIDHWNYGSYRPTVSQLLATAMVIDGVPFASLEEERKWKTAFGRPKDLADLRLMEAHLNSIP